MSYIKHNFNSGDLIMASDFNELEDQVAQNEADIATKQDALTAGENITIDNGVISAEGVSQEYVDDALEEKQNTLVSGTNIKTINGKSLLGSGNITIEGGGGGDDSNYELIESITLSSDTTYYEKKNLDLKALIISITSSSNTDDTAKGGVFSINGSALMNSNGLLRKSRTTVLNLRIQNGRMFGFEINQANNQTNSYYMNASLQMALGVPCEAINSFIFYPSGGASILAGTKIDIYGIRN